MFNLLCDATSLSQLCLHWGLDCIAWIIFRSCEIMLVGSELSNIVNTTCLSNSRQYAPRSVMDKHTLIFIIFIISSNSDIIKHMAKRCCNRVLIVPAPRHCLLRFSSAYGPTSLTELSHQLGVILSRQGSIMY